MNKTSDKAAKAFINGKKYSSVNTVVIVENGEVLMKLFRNIIARRLCRTTSPIILNDCNHQTDTTKDRLNTLLAHYNTLEYIKQANGVWFIKSPTGEREWKINEDNIFEFE